MKQYLFGIAWFCDEAISNGVVSLERIDGLFDNDTAKAGQEKYGIYIEQPRFYENTRVIITMPSQHHLSALRQLLHLGYSEITIIYEHAGVYEERQYDFSPYHYGKEADCLIVLYLQHRSYSGISAIEYMLRNQHITLPSGFQVITMGGKQNETEYYYYAAMADYFITERDGLQVYGKLIQLWHGFPLKALGHMMKRFHSEGNSTTNLWQRYDYIASYGQIYTNFMCACYGTPSSQYWTTGMPRNDLLFVTDGKQNLQKIMPDSAGRKIVLYMPTFREMEHKNDLHLQVDGDADGYLFYWEDFHLKRLEEFCRRNHLYFIFKLHPSDASKVKTWWTSSDCIGILTDEMLADQCLYEYLNAADVLITDYSSVYFDYLLLDRPIIFTDKDINCYAEQRGLILEPLAFWRPGAVVHTIDRLENEIVNAVSGKDFYQEKRRTLLPLIHRYQDGDSTKRLFKAIVKDAKSVGEEETCDVPV